MRAIALLLLLLFAWPAVAQTPPAAPVTVAVRSGDHPGFGRVVFDLPSGVTPVLSSEPGRVGIDFTARGGAAVAVAGMPRPPRNVRGLAAAAGHVDLVLAPRAKLRQTRMGDRLVLDFLDGDASEQDTPAAVPDVAKPAVARPAPSPTAATPPRRIGGTVSADARNRAAEDARAALAQVSGGPSESGPVGPLALAAAQSLPPPVLATMQGVRSIALPFSPSVGAAAFRRGDLALVVFDERRPVDLAPLRSDPVFGAASITVLPSATVLRLPIAAADALRLARVDTGWTISAVPADAGRPAVQPIRPEMVDGRLRLPADAPGQVVSVPDPLTGGSLLVGTQRGVGQGIPVDRRTPEFALLPTWQGVAVVPLTDALTLRANARGFLLAAEADRALAMSGSDSRAQTVAEAAVASRRYDLPAQPTDALLRRLQSATAAAAAAAPQARAAPRRDVAEAMLALGMGPEMQAVLALATGEDARAAEDPDIIGLSAIAALLAGRVAESAGIDDPRLTGTDEIALWRAVRAAAIDEGGARPAAIFASALPLLLSYPEPLRNRLLPLAAQTMALGGETMAAAKLLEAHRDVAGLDLARGLLAEATGAETAATLDLLDRVAAGPDRRARARAGVRAVELRLASGVFDARQAADAMEKLLYAWRGDEREVALRLRLAELRAQAGEWRQAMALLRESRDLFPERSDTIRPQLADIFLRALAQEARTPLKPLDLVALAEENADLIPEGEAGHALAARLADRLTALELPRRATVVLEKLIQATPPGPGRAALGGRLAALKLQQGDAPGALAALAGSAAIGPLPTELLEERTLAFARASAATGALPAAVAALRELATPAADDLRAMLLESAKDWPGATAALRGYVVATIPAEGKLDPTQARTLLRLATLAAQAGDDVVLAQLRDRDLPRVPEGQVRDMLRLLTANPVQAVADLPRAAQEMKLARGVPASLRALSASP